jgi:dihydrofolate synthase/folylpolyglutamate synthase
MSSTLIGNALAQPLRHLADAESLLLQLAAAAAGRPRSAASPATVRALLGAAGRPLENIPAVHLTGSKGKGTTTLLLEGILCAAGLRPLTFTSPHLERWTERLRLGGRELDAETFVARLEATRRVTLTTLLRDEHPGLGFFEFLTAAAILAAHDLGADCLLLEAGMGGRLDATNVLTPRVACITTVELEHAGRLGGTLESIAREKAGIVKPGVPVVSGRLPPAADEIVADAARSVGALHWRLGHELSVERVPVTHQGLPAQHLAVSLGDQRLELFLGVAGAHLADDATLALACARLCGLLGETALGAAAATAYASPLLPGRCEIFGHHPWIVMDAAHTADSVAALAAVLAGLPARRRHLVVSLSGERDPGMLSPLLTGAGAVTVTCGEPSRALAASELAARLPVLPAGVPLRIVNSPIHALEQALRETQAEDLVCVAGSVYLAGLARTHLLATRRPQGSGFALD